MTVSSLLYNQKCAVLDEIENAALREPFNADVFSTLTAGFRGFQVHLSKWFSALKKVEIHKA